ncbi:MAG: hypothetical protein DWQ37_15245 [Planctomycetota bacterium]|nr:MAG: hypothetical protein DWQ37_15245 [Planctomycetota bacterium]
MQTVRTICDELLQWLESDPLFRPDKVQQERFYGYDGKKLPFVEKDPATWEYCINANNEDTAFVELVELLSEVRTACGLLHGYGPRDLVDYVDDQCEAVSATLHASSGVKRMAKKVAAIESADINKSEMRDGFLGAIEDHFQTILKCRVLTLSRRYMPTEAIFEAYRVGLMPFGWDWDSLLCLNPASLE